MIFALPDLCVFQTGPKLTNTDTIFSAGTFVFFYVNEGRGLKDFKSKLTRTLNVCTVMQLQLNETNSSQCGGMSRFKETRFAVMLRGMAKRK